MVTDRETSATDTRREGLVEAVRRAAVRVRRAAEACNNPVEREGVGWCQRCFNPLKAHDTERHRDAQLLREHADDLETLRDFFAEVWPYALSEPEKEALARIASRLTGGEHDG